MSLTSRRGAALAVALFALVVVAALANAIIGPAIAYRRAAVRSTAFQSAESLTESTIAEVVGTWSATRWRGLELGRPWEQRTAAGSADLPRAPFGSGIVDLRVIRIGETIFLLVVESSVGALDAPVAARRTLFLELRSDSVRPAPALTSGGAVTLSAGDDVVRDTTCGEGEPPGLVTLPPGVPLDWPRAGADSLVARDTMAGRQATYDRPAGLDGAQLRAARDGMLAAGVTVTPQPVASDTSCADGATNWGEPLRVQPGTVQACTTTFPVVHAIGDLRIIGGRGQGILVVDGRLEIVGPFRYHGIILAAGGIDVRGGETTVVGAILTGPTSPAAFRADRTRLVASRCMAQDALDEAAKIAPIPEWAWGR